MQRAGGERTTTQSKNHTFGGVPARIIAPNLCTLSVVGYYPAEVTSRKDVYADKPEGRGLVAEQQGQQDQTGGRTHGARRG